jgi:excisionase family DNA binding protein
MCFTNRVFVRMILSVRFFRTRKATMRRLITFRDLCDSLPLAESTVRQLVRDKRIPRVQLARRKWLFDPADVERALQQAGVAVVEPAPPATAASTREGP